MDEDFDLIGLDIAEPFFGAQTGKGILKTHGASKCAGEVCCIHNPSDHHMVTWPQNWRADTGIMERLCSHGVGHPDPDDLKVRTFEGFGVHGCDGCCLTIKITYNTPEPATEPCGCGLWMCPRCGIGPRGHLG